MEKFKPIEKQLPWPEHIEAQQCSGISQKQYCEMHGLKVHNFTYHLKQHRKRTARSAVATDDFIRVAAIAPPKSITIKLSNGISIEWPSNPSHLIEVVKSLREVR